MASAVYVGSPLRSYTNGLSRVEASGNTLQELLADLEAHHTGMRFRMIDEQHRIRPHIRIFIDSREARTLDEPIERNAEVHLVCALSGG